MKVTVLGAGAWGTALARLLKLGGHPVTLWEAIPENLAALRRTGRNDKFLAGVELPGGLVFADDLAEAVREAECVVVAVPSKFFRATTRALAAFRGAVVSVTKGIEYDSGLTMSAVLRENAPQALVAALSGPTLAPEVARDIPTAIVAAGETAEVAHEIQRLFHRPAFRVYTSTDLLGVELGGALKNVIAIAAGVCDGLGFGDNSKAALVTRGVAEIRRLGVACGAKAETFAGLSGLGDLTVTCFSRLSRNRGFGERLGRGEKPAHILATSVSVAEGYPTARSALQLAHRLGVPVPIIETVHAMAYEDQNAQEALRGLLSRESKAED